MRRILNIKGMFSALDCIYLKTFINGPSNVKTFLKIYFKERINHNFYPTQKNCNRETD